MTTDPVLSSDEHLEEALHAKHTNPVLIFVILSAFTAIEIIITLFALPKNVIVPFLLAIAFTKAALIAAYYMHLRYERWIYTAVFLVPAAFAVFLVSVLGS